MNWNGLAGLLYGALGGLFEFLPVSPLVHQTVLQKLLGLNEAGMGLTLAVHLGALAAVFVSCYNQIGKLSREQKILKQPKRSRKRNPDIASLVQIRLLKTASVPMILVCLIMPWLGRKLERMWLLAILTIVSGILVLIPNYMTRGNKDARSMSRLDALLMGFGACLGAVPGFSKVAGLTSVASMRAVDRQFALELTNLLMIPALGALCIGDIAVMIFNGNASPFWPGVLACIAAFGVGLVAIRLMRVLAIKAGYEGFAYYSWGLAMFTFVVYVIG